MLVLLVGVGCWFGLVEGRKPKTLVKEAVTILFKAAAIRQQQSLKYQEYQIINYSKRPHIKLLTINL